MVVLPSWNQFMGISTRSVSLPRTRGFIQDEAGLFGSTFSHLPTSISRWPRLDLRERGLLITHSKVVRNTISVHRTVIIFHPLVDEKLCRRLRYLAHGCHDTFGRLANEFGEQIIRVVEDVFLLLCGELVWLFMRISMQSTVPVRSPESTSSWTCGGAHIS